MSSAQLFEYARADSEIQIFLNDLGGDGERNLYCIARHLFGKLGWQGHRYAFPAGSYISCVGERAVSSALDVILEYARDAGGFFAYADLEEHLRRLGIRTGNLRARMKIGSEPLFFYYTPAELVLVERLGIDEAWLERVRRALTRLFEDIADHVVLRAVWENWYEQLPALPGRRSWTPLLLQYVLKFYGERLGARTIRAMDSQSGTVVHCMVVSNRSEVQNFADAVAVHLIDSGIAKRHFAAEELRKLLVAGGLIAGNELINNMPKALEGDPRFAWDIAGEHVNVQFVCAFSGGKDSLVLLDLMAKALARMSLKWCSATPAWSFRIHSGRSNWQRSGGRIFTLRKLSAIWSPIKHGRNSGRRRKGCAGAVPSTSRFRRY